MKLHNDYQTQTLIDIAGQLAYHDDKINEIANYEVLQEDVENIALYMSNRWLNDENEQVKEGSPLQNRRDFFKENYEEVVKQYFEDPSELPPIDYCKFGPGVNGLLNYIENPRMYMTVADIRYGDYDNNLLICDAGEMPSLTNTIHRCYITQQDALGGIDIDISDEKDDTHIIEGIIFS